MLPCCICTRDSSACHAGTLISLIPMFVKSGDEHVFGKQDSATVLCIVFDCVYAYNSSYVQCHMHSAGTSSCGCRVIQSKHSSCLTNRSSAEHASFWQTARYSAKGCWCLQSDVQPAPPLSRSSEAAGDGRGAAHSICAGSAMLLLRCRACNCADCPAEPKWPWQAPLCWRSNQYVTALV